MIGEPPAQDSDAKRVEAEIVLHYVDHGRKEYSLRVCGMGPDKATAQGRMDEALRDAIEELRGVFYSTSRAVKAKRLKGSPRNGKIDA